ncbi:MAG TPA: T9SS type A sorting domain-containing protein [Prolixibacteraceae bacterium]|nr:T9SS type A sorting domain-containing protein [Prolixibacteraceae bacterium]
MKVRALLLIFFGFFSFVAMAKKDQQNRGLSVNGATMKIIGLNTTEVVRIPPPEAFLNKSGNLAEGINVQVNYKGFPAPARNAFQYAVDIWSSLISSSVPIVIDASWEPLEESVLGQCSPSNYYRNFDGMPHEDVFYPMPLAEKLYHDEINGSEQADINAYFDNDSEWYLGTDGNTPTDKYDLVTVVLHELCHGLGFHGSFYVEGNKGSWGWGMDVPFAFDQFVEDKDDNLLANTAVYTNNSLELKKALTSGAVYFNGPVIQSEIGREVLLYAPTTWDGGSSIYHLANYYISGENRLMCSTTSKGRSVHDPGPITMAMMGEIGWNHISIIHKKRMNTESISSVEILADIIPDFDSEIVSPKLFYSVDKGRYNEVDFSLKSGTVQTYRAVIPVKRSCTVSYYIQVADRYGRNFKMPVTSPETNFEFYVGPDTIAPEIKHYYNTFLLAGQDSIPFQAYVTDAYGIDSVWIEYSVNGQVKSPLRLSMTEENKYEASLNLVPFGLQVGDSVSYRLLARDVSVAGHVAIKPETGTITMKVETIPEFISMLDQEFELTNSDFLLQGFEVSVPDGFQNGALHTLHPYEFAGEASSLEYIAQLRYPVKIDPVYHYLSFDEVVLVEPGEDNTEYGDDEFWDYVIVEASKDEGGTWVPVEPGWDSRLHPVWLTAYNQSIWEQFSQAVGTPAMYKPHIMNLLDAEGLSAGDEILIRFRLYSDPYAYGWGWAIDNLKIQTAGLSGPVYSGRNSIRVYPNPVNNHLLFVDSNGKEIRSMELFTITGARVWATQGPDPSSAMELPTALRGLFVLVVRTDEGDERFKIRVE